jgi:hypothetical protein
MYFLTARNFAWTKTMKIIVIKNMDNHLHPKMFYIIYTQNKSLSILVLMTTLDKLKKIS